MGYNTPAAQADSLAFLSLVAYMLAALALVVQVAAYTLVSLPLQAAAAVYTLVSLVSQVVAVVYTLVSILRLVQVAYMLAAVVQMGRM